MAMSPTFTVVDVDPVGLTGGLQSHHCTGSQGDVHSSLQQSHLCKFNHVGRREVSAAAYSSGLGDGNLTSYINRA